MRNSFIKYIAALLLFGSNGVVASHIHLSSYHIVLMRTLLGSLLLLVLFLATGHKFSFDKEKKDCLFICLSGIAMGASWMFLYEAYTQLGVGIASLLQLFVSFLTVAIFVGIKTGGYAMSIASADWRWIIILGFLNTGIGCYFYFSLIGALPVQTVAVCGYLEPLSAVIFSVLLLGETMLPLQILGAVLIIGGAIFAEHFSPKR